MPQDVSSILMQGLDSGLSIQDVLLSQMDTSDPTMAMVARLIAERSANSNEQSHEESEQGEEVDEFSKHRLKRLLQGVRQLRRDAESLRNEVEELQLRNDTLAAALGACYLCWGECPTCEICLGKGAPGYFPVHVQVFNEFVVPAIRSFKQQKMPPTPVREEVECESIR